MKRLDQDRRCPSAKKSNARPAAVPPLEVPTYCQARVDLNNQGYLYCTCLPPAVCRGERRGGCRPLAYDPPPSDGGEGETFPPPPAASLLGASYHAPSRSATAAALRARSTPMPTELRRLPGEIRTRIEAARAAAARIAGAEDSPALEGLGAADRYLVEALALVAEGYRDEAVDVIKDALLAVRAAESDARLIMGTLDRITKGRG